MESTPHSWTRTREVFLELADLGSEARSEALERLRASDPALAREVAELLDHDLDATELPAESSNARFGPYVAIERIGAGGMGEVYLARRDDGEFEREVAVKVLRGGAAGPDLTARFQRERQTLAALSHESIVRLLDGGTTADGRAYFVMEYVVGVNLDHHARDLERRERLQLFLRVVHAVAHAHGRGVVHRDLKPSNVLVRADGAVRLVDFGIARLLGTDPELERGRTLTRTGQRMFTPEYASPEQVAGERTSPATDVFALGVILYELLAGGSPWPSGGTTHDLERAILEASPPAPSRRATGTQARALRGNLDTIALKCLERDPARRYPDAAALAADLERELSGRTIEARRATALERGLRFVRRRPWHSLAAASTVVALVAAGLVLDSRGEETRRQGALADQMPDRLAAVHGLIQARAFDRAESQLAQAAEDIASLSDAGALDALRRLRVMELELAQGRSARVLEEVEAARSVPAFESPDHVHLALELRFYEANALAGLGRIPEAELVARETMDAAEGVLPPSHSIRIDLATILARAHLERGELDAGYELLESVRQPALERGIENDPVVARIDGLLGRWLREVGRPKEALERLESARSALRWSYGDRHPDVAELTMVLARIRFEEGDLDRAWEEIQAARAAFRAFNSPMMRAYLLELASHVASARGDLEGKLGALEENLENVETHLFPDFRPQWCVSQMHRGITLGEMGRLDESIEAFEAALAPAPGSDVPAVAPKGPQVEAEIRASFAEVLRAAGFPDEARDEFAHAADLFEEALGADHPVTKKARALGDG
ncbi:MAG: serine/threonine-protein kinase [Planctomycetota bacterium]